MPGALNPTHGWSHKFVDELVYPQILKPLTESPAYPIGAAFDCGVAANQGLLMAFELGLGACLTAFNAEVVARYTKPPASWIPLYVLNIGYRAESPEAGAAAAAAVRGTVLPRPVRQAVSARPEGGRRAEAQQDAADTGSAAEPQARDPRAGASVESARVMGVLSRPITEYQSVATWGDGLRNQWGGDPLTEEPEKLQALETFCAFVGEDPDTIVGHCFRIRKSDGERR